MTTAIRRGVVTGVLLLVLINPVPPGPVGPGAVRAQSITFPAAGGPEKPEGRVDVEASPEQVWAVLTDFSAYPIWNPFMYPVKGTPLPGSTLEVTLHPGTGSVTYPATVATARPDHELSWTGQVFSSGLFDVTFTFTIDPLPGGRAHLEARESGKGLAAPAARWLVAGDIPRGLDQMVKALRNRAELLRVAPHSIPGAPVRRP